MTAPPIHASWENGILVVRDDLLPGGTKSRAINALLKDTGPHITYASPAYGYAQVALAHGCRATGRQAHIFTAARKRPHPRTLEAQAAGATIHYISPGYLSQTQARAREFAQATGGTALPFGFDTIPFRVALAAAIREAIAVASTRLDSPHARSALTVLTDPEEVWVAAGSGTLTRTLQEVWPAAEHHAVMVGRHPDAGNATIHAALEPFERDAQEPPPIPSTSNFDAKAWRFVRDRTTRRILWWNVAG